LIAYWNFDEGSGRLAQDSTKSKNHALLVGNARWTRGVLGHAMETLGPTDYAQFLAGASLPQFSLSLWVKVERVQGEGGVFMTAANTEGAIRLYVRGDGFAQLNMASVGAPAPKNRLEPNQWHHIALRYHPAANGQSRVADVFVDGMQDSQLTAGQSVLPIIGPGRMGGWPDDESNRALIGAIDEVRLYGRPLADVEIAALYAAGQATQ
jgi:hypothetical protein